VTEAFILDASIAISWVHPAQATAQTQAMLDAVAEGATLIVPAVWPLEVANALLVLVRRRKLVESDRQIALGWMRGLRVQVDQEAAAHAWDRLSEIAAAHHLSVYDASYLEVAQRRRLALGCKDGPLRKAAVRAGVRLWT
jgi:predicted nucleic acid-binding protein